MTTADDFECELSRRHVEFLVNKSRKIVHNWFVGEKGRSQTSGSGNERMWSLLFVELIEFSHAIKSWKFES